MADALQYAHNQGIIHRDIKPSNLLLDLAGTAWVTDFGLAKGGEAEKLTGTGDILGTLRYMPPEAFEGKADARSDVYSLGLTLYEMLALRPAFEEHDRHKLIKQVSTAEPVRLRKRRPGVPRDLETIVHKAIEREPGRRYQSAEELAADLQRFIDDEPIKARRQSAREAGWRWARRHKSLAALVTVIFLVLLGTAVGALALAARFQSEKNIQTQLADRNQKLAEEKESALADMLAFRGQQAGEQGLPALATLWFAKAAEQSPSDASRQALNSLRARNWSREAIVPVGALSLHQGLKSIDFGPGGNLLLIRTSTRFFVWDWQSEKRLPWADGKQSVSAACWSPDGSKLVVALNVGGVQVRSVPDGKVLCTLDHPAHVSSLACDPNGRFLAIASNFVQIWDLQSYAAVGAILRHPQAVDAMVFNRKGDRLVTACKDKKARVFAVAGSSTAEPLFPPVAHAPATPSPPAFIDEDRGLLTIRDSNHLNWCNAETGKQTAFRDVMTRPIMLNLVVANRKGDWFAVGGRENAQVWTTADQGKNSFLLEHRNNVTDVVFDSKGANLFTASWDQTVRQWSIPGCKPLGEPLLQMGEAANCAISWDDKYLATARTDGLVRIWKRPEAASSITRYPEWATRARVSPNGLFLAPGCWHEAPNPINGIDQLVVLNSGTGRPAGPALSVPGMAVDSCVCADNQTLAVISVKGSAGYLSFYDVPTGLRLTEPAMISSIPLSVAGRPKQAQVAVLCQNNHVLIFDVGKDKPILDLARESGKYGRDYSGVGRTEYTPDGAMLVSLSLDGTAIHVCDASTGELEFPPIRPAQAGANCRSFAISRDGKLLATAVNGRNAAQVWDLTDGRAICQPLPHPGDRFGLFHVVFSPDGRYLLTGCKDGQARLWDWKAGMLACPPLQHQDEVFAVAFSRDGRYALTAVRGPDGGVQVWELATGKEVAPRISTGQSVFSVTLSPDGAHAFACTKSTLVLLSLGELLAPPDEPAGDLALLGELGSAQRIELGDLSGLTMEEWLERWGRFHQEYVDNHGDELAAGNLNDPRGQLARFRLNARLERPAEALASLNRALELNPALTLEAEDLKTLIALAESAAARAEWPLVASALTRLLRTNPTYSDLRTWSRAAIVQAYMGNAPEYRRICEAIVEKFGKTGEWRTATMIAKTCLLLPGEIPHLSKVEELAELDNKEHGASRWSWWHRNQALLAYRTARFAEAAEWCARSMKVNPGPEVRVSVSYILAMVQYRQGEVEKAKKTLAQGNAAIPELSVSVRDKNE